MSALDRLEAADLVLAQRAAILEQLGIPHQDAAAILGECLDVAKFTTWTPMALVDRETGLMRSELLANTPAELVLEHARERLQALRALTSSVAMRRVAHAIGNDAQQLVHLEHCASWPVAEAAVREVQDAVRATGPTILVHLERARDLIDTAVDLNEAWLPIARKIRALATVGVDHG